jgi:hypothetical protein
MWSSLGQVASLIATASLIPIRARGSSPTRQETPSRRYLEVRTLLDVWLRWRRFWIGSDVWSVRPRVTSRRLETPVTASALGAGSWSRILRPLDSRIGPERRLSASHSSLRFMVDATLSTLGLVAA